MTVMCRFLEHQVILMTIKIMDSTRKTNMPKEDASYMNLDLKIDETRQESIFWKK